MRETLDGRKSKNGTSKKRKTETLRPESRVERQRRGYKLARYFTIPGKDPFDQVEWELRTAQITGETGKVYFVQENCEIPKAWSATATNVVVQKYFRGIVGTPQRERSVRQLIGRVAETITGWGKKQKYFASDADVATFRDELVHLL